MKTTRILLASALLLIPALVKAQTVSGRSQIQALAEEKAGRTAIQQKIDSQILYAAKELRGEPIAGGKTTVAANIEYLADARVLVDIRTEVTPAVLAAIARTGGTVVNSFPAARAVRAKIFIQRVEEIAKLAEVQTVRRAAKARTNVITSQGDATHRGPAARATYSSRGAGVKVGILSDSVDFLAGSYASGELPALTILPGQAGTGSGEGTAMLEIVHDLAPGAQLYFATAFNGEASFAKNIRDLRAAGCDIIVDDVGYFSESPFQDDLISQAVNDVTASGALYFSSAGNSGNKNDNTSGTWEGDFVDGGPASAPVDLKSGRLHRFGAVNYNPCVAGGSDRNVSLFWADPLAASANDYDVYVLDATGSTVLSASNSTQNGTQDPWEYIDTLNVGDRIVVVKATGAARFLHLDTGRARLATSTNGNTRGHASAANAFCVAAVAAPASFPGAFVGGATNPVETFSSDGPRRVFYNANGTAITPGNFLATGGAVRQKPDLAAADGVSTSVPGFLPFYGTSAAAPHAGAIAALLKSYNPALTAAQVRTALLAGCLEIEAAGVDPDSGAGLLMATNALQAAPAPVPAPRIAANGLTLVSETVVPFNSQIDPAEIVTVSLGLQNGGALATTNLIATLLSADGVTEPSAAQTYGVLAASGGTATRQFTFRANGPLGGTNKAKLQLNDGAADLGVVEFTFALAAGATSTTPTAGPGGFTIPLIGAATPYPSSLTVAGSSGVITKVTATLTGFTHTYPGDTGALLVGPGGQKVLLYAGAGGGTGISGVNLTFDDAAATALSSTGAMTTGAYKPSAFGTTPAFIAPAPASPFEGAMSAFNGASANGAWQLFVSDFYDGDSGSLTGWSLSITTATPGPAASGTADLAVSLNAPATAVLGSTQPLFVTVRNNGPAACTGATATYALPAGVAYVSSSSTQGPTAFSSGVLTATIGALASGASATVTINITTTAADFVIQTASATSATVDPDHTNNQATAFQTVGSVDLAPYQPSGWSDVLVVAKTAGVFTDAPLLTTADTLYPSWAVTNTGSAASNAGFAVAIYVDGTLSTTSNLAIALDPFFYAFWDYATVAPLSPGSHTIRMAVDSAGSVAESDEANNEYTKTINIAQIAAASAANFILAPMAGHTDTFNNAGFNLTVSGLTSIGQNGTGTMTWSGGTFAMSSAGSFVGQNGGSSGALTVASGAVTYPTLEIGSQAAAQGALTLNGTATMTAGTATIIGKSGFGSFNKNGGTLTTPQLVIGMNAGSTGSFTSTAGTTSGTSLVVGQGGSLTINGGTLAFTTLSANSAGTISFSKGALSVVSSAGNSGAAPLVVGDGTNVAALTLGGGAHTFTGGIRVKAASTISLTGAQAGGAALALEGGTVTGSGTVGALAATAGSVLDLGGPSAATLTTGEVQLAAGVNHKVDFTASGADQLGVNGPVTLGGATLAPTLRTIPTIGQQFILVQNDGADAVVGTFSGLAEGAILSLTNVGAGGGTFPAQIRYTGGTGNDVVVTFGAASAANIGAATSVGSTGATLNGLANPNGLLTTGQFQYGVSVGYGYTTASQDFGAGTAYTPASSAIGGLAAHTLYHYRLVTTNGVSSTNSSDATFTTLNTNPSAPDAAATASTGDQKTIAITFPAADVDGDAVTLTGVTPGAHLAVNSMSGANVTFTADANYVGPSTLGYTVSDGFSGTATGTITVGITDNDGPVVGLHANVSAEATSAAGAVATYAAATATDNIAVASITYSQDSGTLFPIGATTVTATAMDAAGNTGTTTFRVNVNDTTAPFIAPHAAVIAEAASAAGAMVGYAAATVADAVGVSAVTYSQDSGALFPIGTTTVTITSKDAADNTSTGTFTVTVRDTTGPVIAAHANVVAEAADAAGAVVNFAAAAATDAVTASPTILYSQASGTLFRLGATTVTITSTDAVNNMSTATFTVTVQDTTAPVVTPPPNQLFEATSSAGAVGNYPNATVTDTVSASPATTYSKNSGRTFAIGTTTVTVTATDDAGRQGTGTFTVTIRDTTAPVLTLPADVAVGTPDPLGTLVTYPAATASDAVTASPVVTYSKASGTLFPIGATTVTVTTKDAVNNTSTGTFTVNVTLTSVQTAALATSGAAVPGAGSDARIAAGATWASFGPPAVNDAGQIAFLGKWSAPKTLTEAAQKRAGIFLGGTLVAAATESVPGLTGSTFKTFKDPLLAPDGSVAFSATIAGAKTGTVLLSNAGGSLAVVARTGDALAVAGGAKWNRFTGMWADTHGLLFTGLLTLGTGTPKAAPANDQVFCKWEPAAGIQILLREGAGALKSFKTFAPGLGSPGQARGWAQYAAGVFRGGVLATLADGTQCILGVDGAGSIETLTLSGPGGPGAPTAGGVFKSYSFPAFATGMRAPAFLGTLIGGGKSIYQLDEASGTSDALATIGAAAPALGAATFSALQDPVLSSDGATVAFLAKIKGTGITAATHSTLWWQPDGGALTLLARTGAQPAEVPTGAQWKTLTSLAMSQATTGQGRPLFVGALVAKKGGVNATNDIAVWSVDTPGVLRLAFREGDRIGSKTIQSFTVLKATVGTPGVARNVNEKQRIAWLAKFTDGTTGIVQTQVP